MREQVGTLGVGMAPVEELDGLILGTLGTRPSELETKFLRGWFGSVPLGKWAVSAWFLL